jgi:hypothetical protein
VGRGLGKLQREVLRIVDEAPMHQRIGGPPCVSVANLTAAIFGEGASDTHRRSVARAAATLRDRGLVEVFRSAERFRRDLVDKGTRLSDWIDPDDPEPVTGWEKLLRQAGLVERRHVAVQVVPVVETFVCRVRAETSLPAEVVEADRSYR